MEYTDLDPDTVRRANAPAANPSTATRSGDAATQIGSTTARLAGVTDGVTPERLGGDAVAIRQRVSALADAATKAPAIRAEIARAFATFNSVAPTPEQLRAAEKAYTDASAASTAANEKAGAAGATQADQTAADDAGKAAADAKKALADLVAQRKTARDALFEALRAAAKKVLEIKAGRSQHDGGSGVKHGSDSGATAGSGGTGSTANAPGKSNGGSGSTPAPAAQAPGATAPTGTSPVTKTSSTTTDPSALLSAFSQQAQQPQAQQQPTTQPQVAAQVPQQGQQAQTQQGKQDGRHGLATDGILDEEDIARLTGEAGTAGAAGLAGLGAGLGAAATPAGNGFGTQYRPSGTPIQGTTAGSTPVQAAPSPTTGTSRTDLVTSQGNTEVSGRSEPARTATDPAPGTRLSSADPVNQTGTRPGATAPGGMPMSPGMMGAPLSSPAASNQKGQRDERTPVTAYPDREQYLLHGGDSLSEATPGGTIAQNRPTRDDPRRPGRAA
ncbi:Uncharacterised protein [Mycobacteroides abscessus subsp. abscessus]|uniref:hypothetical protein n=1 Tax=Mycobacteroides abscessus TaxID=36809 RepID=UPI000928F84F|nr:hypothetical protein [Mycobacteroides abscessus]SHR98750.1 Uncharacterised protein [Mycobacteroides abscessus subsp. abscessus]